MQLAIETMPKQTLKLDSVFWFTSPCSLILSIPAWKTEVKWWRRGGWNYWTIFLPRPFQGGPFHFTKCIFPLISLTFLIMLNHFTWCQYLILNIILCTHILHWSSPQIQHIISLSQLPYVSHTSHILHVSFPTYSCIYLMICPLFFSLTFPTSRISSLYFCYTSSVIVSNPSPPFITSIPKQHPIFIAVAQFSFHSLINDSTFVVHYILHFIHSPFLTQA